MTFEQRRSVVLAFWMLMVVTIAVVLAVNTPTGWGLIGAIAVIPAAIALWLWAPPGVTMPHIHVAQR